MHNAIPLTVAALVAVGIIVIGCFYQQADGKHHRAGYAISGERSDLDPPDPKMIDMSPEGMMSEAKMRVDAMAGLAAPPFHPILTDAGGGLFSRCSGPQCV